MSVVGSEGYFSTRWSLRRLVSGPVGRGKGFGRLGFVHLDICSCMLSSVHVGGHGMVQHLESVSVRPG
eukprot:1394431-Pleurochrysis_carterae.AAC.1